MWPKHVGGYAVYTTVDIRVCYHYKSSALTVQSWLPVRLLLQQRDPRLRTEFRFSETYLQRIKRCVRTRRIFISAGEPRSLKQPAGQIAGRGFCFLPRFPPT
jgi:hypothetical protein